MDVKNYIEAIVKKKSVGIDLLTLPLISQYRVVTFFGTAIGQLAPAFDITQFQNRLLVIKSIKMDYYATEVGIVDIEFSDGTTEDIANTVRINRIFDVFNQGFRFDMLVNGASIGLFGNAGTGSIFYPSDIFVDNIFYLYPEKIQTWEMFVDGDLAASPSDATLTQVYCKVTVECYII